MAILSLSTLQQSDDQKITAGLYGVGGSGKTTFLSTYKDEKDSSVLIFDFDQKSSGISAIPEKKIIPSGNINIARYSAQGIAGLPKQFSEWQRDWKTLMRTGSLHGITPGLVAFDTITTMEMLSTAYILSQKEAHNDKMNQADWGSHATFYNNLFFNTQSLPFHLIFCFHEFVREEGEGIEGRQPLIGGKAALLRIPSLLQEIWWLQQKKDERILWYKNAPRMAVANSINLTGSGSLKEPTWEGIMKLKKGSL